MLYLASPFFNEVENNALDGVENAMDGNRVTYFSPRKAPGNEEDASFEDKLSKAPAIFKKDIEMMENADILFAYTDGYPFKHDGRAGIARDAGTSFELGYFYCKQAVKSKVPNIVTFSAQGFGSNLMIAEASKLHLGNQDEIEDFFNLAGEIWEDGAFVNAGQNYYYWANVIDAYIANFNGKGMTPDVDTP